MGRLAYAGSVVGVLFLAAIGMVSNPDQAQVFIALATIAMMLLGGARAADALKGRVSDGPRFVLSIVIGFFSPIVLIALILCCVPAKAKEVQNA